MKKLRVMALALVLLLMASAAAEAPMFDETIAILNEFGGADYSVDCRYDSGDNTIYYTVMLGYTAAEFAVANGSDAAVMEYRQTMLLLARSIEDAFKATERPDVGVYVGVYSRDRKSILGAKPFVALYLDTFEPWNERSADYLDDID